MRHACLLEATFLNRSALPIEAIESIWIEPPGRPGSPAIGRPWISGPQVSDARTRDPNLRIDRPLATGSGQQPPRASLVLDTRIVKWDQQTSRGGRLPMSTSSGPRALE